MLYKRKHKNVLAHKYEGTLSYHNSPEWIKNLFDKGKLKFLQTKFFSENLQLVLEDKYGDIIVDKGDYIVYDPEDGLYTMDHKKFEALYEVCEYA